MKPFDIAKLLGIKDMSSHLRMIERSLKSIVTSSNPALREPMIRLIHARSKRLRSMIVIAAATSRGKQVSETTIKGCTAIELIHIGSLVHDDIIDRAESRWGIPTVSSLEGTSQAILVGDYMFAQACVIAADIDVRAAKLAASTISSLCDGESCEVADEFNQDRTIESMNAAISGKTAALISAACQMGGICAGFDDKRILNLANYGKAFGMSYQLIDDVLDFVSSEELMGKPVGNDVKEGVYTLPLLMALKEKRADELRRLLAEKPVNSDKISDILASEGYIRRTLQEAEKFNLRAMNAVKDTPGMTGLAKLPGAYMDWAINNLFARRVT